MKDVIIRKAEGVGFASERQGIDRLGVRTETATEKQ